MLDRFEIRLSGTGGQGLVLAGIILAEAAGIYEGKNVVQTGSYGPAARGGTSRADVVISDYLVNPALLLTAPADAEMVELPHHAGTTAQEAIVARMIAAALCPIAVRFTLSAVRFFGSSGSSWMTLSRHSGSGCS